MPLNIYRILIDGILVIIASTVLTYYRDISNGNVVEEKEAIVEIAKITKSQQDELYAIARKLVESGKGILAADESIDTIGKRFATIGMVNNATNRNNYRYLLFTTPNISQYISGIILHEETFNQRDEAGKRFVDIIREAGMLPGIKLDKGLEQFDGSLEYITRGLDDLKERAVYFKKGGCQFAKWRCVYVISEVTPSRKVLKENAKILAQYAISSQQAGLVPIIEPEVLCDGKHNLERVGKVTEQVLAEVYKSLHDHSVYLEGTLLKPNMVVSSNTDKIGHDKIAKETLRSLTRTVPAAVPGIVFLSGGQLESNATRNLNEINKIAINKPWKLSFSYGRALQTSALKAWMISGPNEAQATFRHRAKLNALAAEGNYIDGLEFKKNENYLV